MNNQFQDGILIAVNIQQPILLKSIVYIFAPSELALQYLLKVGHA